MKKFLLGTTALVGLAASTAAVAGGSHYAAPAGGSAVNAGGLTVIVGGVIDSQISITDQENTARTGNVHAPVNGTQELNDFDFATDAEIHFTVAGSAEDFDYGAVIELNTNIDGDADGDSNNTTINNAGQNSNTGVADKAYIFVESDNFGRVEFGGNEGASNTMEIDASNIARATGGIDGDFDHYADLNATGAGNIGGSQVSDVRPNLVIADDDSGAADAQKLTYYTPKFSGLQLGVSYTPDTGNLGTASGLSGSSGANNANNEIEDAFTAGLSFDTDLDGIGLAISAVGEQGDFENDPTPNNGDNEEYTGYSIGAKVELEGFSLAGNVFNTELETVGGTADLETDGYSIGAAFANGPYGISVTYLNTETEAANGNTDEFENIVVGADYQMAPGFTPYIEAAFFDDENNGALGTTVDNEGSVVLLGAELSF